MEFFHAAWNCMKQHGIAYKKSMQHEKRHQHGNNNTAMEVRSTHHSVAI
jgi:hypothetical protein